MSCFIIDHLCYSYGSHQILKNITFQIEKGSSFGIIGPNGSGKSTLIRCISGLYTPQKGTILFENRMIKSFKKKELARKIAVLEQNELPCLSFSVEEIVSMGRYPWLKPFKDLGEEDRAIVENVLAKLDLWDKRQKPVNTLSGGQRQLVALARAMVQNPQVLILDEPTTYLDLGHQHLVMEHVRRWQEDSKGTVIMVLHDLNLASQYCNKLLLLEKGEIRRWGDADRVLNHQTISDVYQTNIVLVNHPTLGVPQFLLGR